MSAPLKVLISGTGFAGQGHADAFRGAGDDNNLVLHVHQFFFPIL